MRRCRCCGKSLSRRSASPTQWGLPLPPGADCISDEVADYLGELARRTYLEVELGLQTIHDATGERINRCHSYADFLTGYHKLQKRGVNVCVHIIDGLPGETHEMMLQTAQALSRLQLHSIKIHLLHLLKGTRMAEEYARGEFALLSREEYVQIVCDQLELLPPELVIQRLTGDGRARVAHRADVEPKKAGGHERDRQGAGPPGLLAGQALLSS